MSRLRDMPVIVVNNYPGPTLGGGEVQLLPVIRGLLREGARVTVVAAAGSAFASRCSELGARVVERPMSGTRTLALVVALRALVDEACDLAPSDARPLVLGTGYFTNLLVRLASRGRAAVVNVVAVVPGASRLDGGSASSDLVRRAADRLTAGVVEHYIAVSGAVREVLVERGAPGDRVHVILNGVDVEAISAAEPLLLDSEGRPVVACISRLERVKGVENFVRAARLVEGALFVVAGGGTEESRLRELAVAAGQGSAVTFLGTHASAAAVIARADVVVVPSLSEAFGLVAAEAMAAGKPVVATRVGGLPEVVEDGVTGMLVEAGDAAALAAGVSFLLGDPQRATAMGRAGRQRTERLFTQDRMVEEYVELLGGISSGGGR